MPMLADTRRDSSGVDVTANVATSGRRDKVIVTICDAVTSRARSFPCHAKARSVSAPSGYAPR